jgi:hypothetical protein
LDGVGDGVRGGEADGDLDLDPDLFPTTTSSSPNPEIEIVRVRGNVGTFGAVIRMGSGGRGMGIVVEMDCAAIE